MTTNTTSGHNGDDEYTRNSAHLYVRFYKDFHCTIPIAADPSISFGIAVIYRSSWYNGGTYNESTITASNANNNQYQLDLGVYNTYDYYKYYDLSMGYMEEISSWEYTLAGGEKYNAILNPYYY
ncbi:hypothetical protein DDR33_09805 [Pararcticibacter amylolyticus]|uniref:Uncharacterized protein n=2 Tax=Pararcticibacter amylolyticus TaxID=2173175 RepID=A0A2U2PH56_9SPHI|nr:hypothetical protein DDR33_09805 [Pararcticibacter amylolyticus]